MAGYGPMGAMSPEEEEELLRSAMMNQGSGKRAALLASANRDYSSREDSIAQQRALAAEMMTGDAPKGVQMGDIYAGPTWSAGLASMAEKLVGGYKGKKAREAGEELGLSKAKSAADKGKLEDLRRQEGWDEAERRRLADDEARKGAASLKADAALTAAQTTDTREDETGKGSTMIDPSNLDAGSFLVRETRQGEFVYGNPNNENYGEPVPKGARDLNEYRDNERLELAAAVTGDEKAMRRQSEKLDQRLINYSKQMEKSQIPRVKSDISQVDEFLSTLDLQTDESGVVTGEVPGMGFGQNTPVLGAALTFGEELFADEGSPESKGSQMRALVQRVLNTEIRSQSGAAVTLQEMVRNRTGASADWLSSDEDFLKMWPIIKETLAEVEGNIAQGYGPEVTDVYNRRGAGEDLTTMEYFEEQAEIAELRKLLEEEEEL